VCTVTDHDPERGSLRQPGPLARGRKRRTVRLLVHGDHHVLELESFKDASMRPVPNTFRLQVPGDSLVHAVRILVDPDAPGVFGFVPLIVPENGPF